MNTKIGDEEELHPAEHDALWHNQTTAKRGIEACRAALTQATASLCPHGVPWTNCHQHQETG
jgi:hypothetical protein